MFGAYENHGYLQTPSMTTWDFDMLRRNMDLSLMPTSKQLMRKVQAEMVPPNMTTTEIGASLWRMPSIILESASCLGWSNITSPFVLISKTWCGRESSAWRSPFAPGKGGVGLCHRAWKDASEEEVRVWWGRLSQLWIPIEVDKKDVKTANRKFVSRVSAKRVHGDILTRRNWECDPLLQQQATQNLFFLFISLGIYAYMKVIIRNICIWRW